MISTTNTKTKNDSATYNTTSGNADNIADNVNNVTFIILICLAGIIGLWGFLSLIAGLVYSGGILDLASEWLGAVIGL